MNATAAQGYEFVNWTEASTGLIVSTNEYSFIADKNRTLTANFIKKTYLIKATANHTEGGTVTDGIETAATSFSKTFTFGDNITMTATASPGYDFVNWTEDGTSLNVATASYAFSVDMPRELKSNFVKKTFLIKAVTNPSEG